jgi:hypothetical protein
LRKALLTRLADASKTVHQIAAVSGHKTLKEVERYTRAADQRRLAREELLGEQNGLAGVKPFERLKTRMTIEIESIGALTFWWSMIFSEKPASTFPDHALVPRGMLSSSGTAFCAVKPSQL